MSCSTRYKSGTGIQCHTLEIDLRITKNACPHRRVALPNAYSYPIDK